MIFHVSSVELVSKLVGELEMIDDQCRNLITGCIIGDKIICVSGDASWNRSALCLHMILSCDVGNDLIGQK